MIAQHRRHDVRFPIIRDPGEAEEHDATARSLLSKHQLAEILVGRDQNGRLPGGASENLLVGRRRRVFGYVLDIVSVLTQPLHHLPLNALVTE